MEKKPRQLTSTSAKNALGGASQLSLERQCRRAYIYNPSVAAFLIREGRVSEDFEKMREYYASSV
jgi:hypothetical protein